MLVSEAINCPSPCRRNCCSPTKAELCNTESLCTAANRSRVRARFSSTWMFSFHSTVTMFSLWSRYGILRFSITWNKKKISGNTSSNDGVIHRRLVKIQTKPLSYQRNRKSRLTRSKKRLTIPGVRMDAIFLLP